MGNFLSPLSAATLQSTNLVGSCLDSPAFLSHKISELSFLFRCYLCECSCHESCLRTAAQKTRSLYVFAEENSYKLLMIIQVAPDISILCVISYL